MRGQTQRYVRPTRWTEARDYYWDLTDPRKDHSPRAQQRRAIKRWHGDGRLDLNPRNRAICSLYVEGFTQREIAARARLTQPRISQILNADRRRQSAEDLEFCQENLPVTCNVTGDNNIRKSNGEGGINAYHRGGRGLSGDPEVPCSYSSITSTTGNTRRGNMTVPCNGTGDTSITPTLTRRFTPEEWKRAVPGLKRVGKQIQGPCPNCGGKDRFHVNIEPPHLFGCRQCEDGASMMREAGLLQDASWRHRPRMRPRKSGWKKGTPRIPSFGLPRHRSKMSLADYEAAATEEPGSVTDLSWEDIPALALGGSEIERELEKTRELADQELAENLDVDWGITDERYAELMQPVPDPSELMAEIRFFLPHGDVILPLKHLRRLIPEAKRLGIDLAKAMWSIAEERKRAAARR